MQQAAEGDPAPSLDPSVFLLRGPKPPRCPVPCTSLHTARLLLTPSCSVSWSLLKKFPCPCYKPQAARLMFMESLETQEVKLLNNEIIGNCSVLRCHKTKTNKA